jgi:hypothetical protein
MASTEIRDRRRTLRYRGLVLRQTVQMKNRVSGLLMESGVSYDKQRLHKMGYFTELFSTNEEVGDSIRPLLRLGCEHSLRGQRLDRALTAHWNGMPTNPVRQAAIHYTHDNGARTLNSAIEGLAPGPVCGLKAPTLTVPLGVILIDARRHATWLLLPFSAADCSADYCWRRGVRIIETETN